MDQNTGCFAWINNRRFLLRYMTYNLHKLNMASPGVYLSFIAFSSHQLRDIIYIHVVMLSLYRNGLYTCTNIKPNDYAFEMNRLNRDE